MNEEQLRKILEKLREGQINTEEALNALRDFDYKDLDFAKIDNHRQLRTGYPEVVFGQNKTPDQAFEIVKYMLEHENNILVTRTSKEVYDKVKKIAPEAEFNEMAQTLTIRKKREKKPDTHIAVVSAGTSDMSVSEEAAITAEIFDNEVKRYYDVGVAGIHRFYDKLSEIRKARVVIVVAGMEGALPSIVGGMVNKPVIAVPTSVGYGANFGGLSALLGMLTSCASGVSVVNIDNGFGAGYLASMINKL
ncbi:MAG: nickel pincer cofactor biosynthesis protein LarB [Bacteroidales bacterium]|nr:nickel pincer cofactor biosynthesis protein LarB [Bacteroidales bacterium]